MVKEITECTYYKRACSSGCDKAYCQSQFPLKSPLIMEDLKKTCLSDEHKECLRYIEGLEFHAKRVREKAGCPFVTNTQCGHPDIFWCMGSVPPFRIEGANLELLSACLGNEYSDCPSYKVGVAFRIEANRIGKMREEEAKDNTSQIS